MLNIRPGISSLALEWCRFYYMACNISSDPGRLLSPEVQIICLWNFYSHDYQIAPFLPVPELLKLHQYNNILPIRLKHGWTRSHVAPSIPIRKHALKSRTNSTTTPQPVAPMTISPPRPSIDHSIIFIKFSPSFTTWFMLVSKLSYLILNFLWFSNSFSHTLLLLHLSFLDHLTSSS